MTESQGNARWFWRFLAALPLLVLPACSGEVGELPGSAQLPSELPAPSDTPALQVGSGELPHANSQRGLPPQFVPGPLIEEPAGGSHGSSMAPGELGPLAPVGDQWPEPGSQIVLTTNGFTPEGRRAIALAASIWARTLRSPVPIRVTANWTVLPGWTLASGGPVSLTRDFPRAPRSGTYYPIALANSLAGTDLDPSAEDVVFHVNSTFEWYLGVDGAPGERFDLVTVAMHELGHGFGFLGSQRVVEGVGSWGTGSPPAPGGLDVLIRNAAGQLLIDTSAFPNPSVQLAGQLTSEALFFEGFNIRIRNNAQPARAFAPPQYSGGSSISHLDDGSYPPGSRNSLMTPSVGLGEVIRELGPVTVGLMADLGWSVFGHPETLCQISQPRCPDHPERVSVFYDTEISAHVNQDRCMQRAEEYYAWCGGPTKMKDATSTARFFSGDTFLSTREVGSWCLIRQASCPNVPSLVGSFVDEYWASGSYASAPACMARAQQYYDHCGGRAAMGATTTTAQFFFAGGLEQELTVGGP